MVDIFPHILSTVLAGQALNRNQALELLSTLPHKFTALIAMAGLANTTSKPFTCGIINAKSGLCGEDCAFCAQSRYHNTNAPIHKLVSEETLYKHACLLAERGVKRMGIVTSGGSPSEHDLEKICHAAENIVKNTKIKLCASLGILSEKQLTCLIQAGFTSYHHNLETSKSYYPSICTTHSYDIRENTVLLAKTSGLRSCSGCLFGMGESWEQRLELSEALQKLEVDSIPINFLIPIKGTLLEKTKTMKPQEAMTIIAIMRLMHPDKDIIICGGRGQCLEEWDRSLFFAGANGLMIGDYLTAKGSAFERDMEILSTLGLDYA